MLQPCLVLVVRVLDVLRQPVLGPVDLFTTNRHLLVLKNDPESIMLHPVVYTVVALHSAEVALFIQKVLLHVVLQSLQQDWVIGVLGHMEDVLKEYSDVGLRNLMFEVALITKVCVLDVLGSQLVPKLINSSSAGTFTLLITARKASCLFMCWYLIKN